MTSPAPRSMYHYTKCSNGDTLPANAVFGGDGIDGNRYYHIRGVVNNLWIPGKAAVSPTTSKLLNAYIPYGSKENILSSYEVLTTTHPTAYVRCKDGDNAPDGAVVGGSDDGPSYFARALTGGVWQPGKVGVHSTGVALLTACIPWDGREPRFGDFEVLVIKQGNSLYEYVRCSSGDLLPDAAVAGGIGVDGDQYYFVRGVADGVLVSGKAPVTSHNLKLRTAYLPYGGKEHEVARFEVLTTKYPTAFVACKAGDKVPNGAVQGGYDGGPSYHARAEVSEVKQPGKAGVANEKLLKLLSACIPWNGGEPRYTNFEVLVISDPVMKVEFHIDEGKMLEDTPRVLAVKTISNNTDSEQSVEFSFTETVSRTSSFSHTAGVSISVGTTFSTGVPFIAGGEISTELSTSYDHTWGEDSTTEQSFSSTFPVKAKPHSTVRCEAIVSEGKMDVPYKITFKSGRTSSGTWEGTSAWNLRAEYKKVSKA